METFIDSYERERAQRAAIEAEHNCKIVKEYKKVPPADFQELVVRHAGSFYAITHPRFVENFLVASEFTGFGGPLGSCLSAMLEGLEMGYTLGRGTPTPYSISYVDVKLTKEAQKLYKGKTFFEILDLLNADLLRGAPRYEDLPTYLFTKKKVTEQFVTHAEAWNRREELRARWNDVAAPETSDNWAIKYDETKDGYF